MYKKFRWLNRKANQYFGEFHEFLDKHGITYQITWVKNQESLYIIPIEVPNWDSPMSLDWMTKYLLSAKIDEPIVMSPDIQHGENMLRAICYPCQDDWWVTFLLYTGDLPKGEHYTYIHPFLIDALLDCRTPDELSWMFYICHLCGIREISSSHLEALSSKVKKLEDSYGDCMINSTDNSYHYLITSQDISMYLERMLKGSYLEPGVLKNEESLGRLHRFKNTKVAEGIRRRLNEFIEYATSNSADCNCREYPDNSMYLQVLGSTEFYSDCKDQLSTLYDELKLYYKYYCINGKMSKYFPKTKIRLISLYSYEHPSIFIVVTDFVNSEVMDHDTGLVSPDLLCLHMLACTASNMYTSDVYLTSVIIENMKTSAGYVSLNLPDATIQKLQTVKNHLKDPTFREKVDDDINFTVRLHSGHGKTDLQYLIDLLDNVKQTGKFSTAQKSSACDQDKHPSSDTTVHVEYDETYIKYFWENAPGAAKAHIYSEMLKLLKPIYN